MATESTERRASQESARASRQQFFLGNERGVAGGRRFKFRRQAILVSILVWRLGPRG